MDTPQIVSLLIAITSLIGVVLAYFKFKPGEKQRVDMNVSQAHMNIAQGTFQMVTSELEDQFKRMSADMADLHRQLREMRNALEDVQVELGQTRRRLDLVTEERDKLRKENAALRDKVTQLEGRILRMENDKG